MYNALLKYLGKKEAFYLFGKIEDQEIVRFHHVRSDLIYNFDLFSERCINKTFKVQFFISNHNDSVSRIISELELQEE